MRLKLTMPEGKAFMPGFMSKLLLNDVDVSQWVEKVVVINSAQGPVRAEVSFFLTGLDVDIAAEVVPLLNEAREESCSLGGLNGLVKPPMPNKYCGYEDENEPMRVCCRPRDHMGAHNEFPQNGDFDIVTSDPERSAIPRAR